jgi:PPOX class probable F420-dependent enzyme
MSSVVGFVQDRHGSVVAATVCVVRLNATDAWIVLRTSHHGVLATVHPERGVDAVPVVFALAGERVVVPVDTVKQKATTRLQRLVNLAQDPRCVLLVDHYDDDWSRLWWVRVHATAEVVDGRHDALTRFPQYRDDGTEVTGWQA